MSAKDTKKPARAKRGRTETQAEFAEIAAEVEAQRETDDPKARQTAELREAEVRAQVEGIGVEGIVRRLSSLELEVAAALGDVSRKLIDEVRLLASLREAVAVEQAELARLHKIDIAATALDVMVRDHGQEKERLDAEIATQRAAWEEEQEQFERTAKEQEDALKRQRQREVEDFEYKKALERKKAQDKYEEEQRLLAKTSRERQEAMEKTWAVREAELKEREEHLARLVRESEGFPGRLVQETQAAAAEAERRTEARLQNEMLVLKKDAEAERRLAELRITTLEQARSGHAAQVAALEKQLGEAKQQVQDIAVRAIDGASGARALSHANQIAMEQAKNRPPG